MHAGHMQSIYEVVSSGHPCTKHLATLGKRETNQNNHTPLELSSELRLVRPATRSDCGEIWGKGRVGEICSYEITVWAGWCSLDDDDDDDDVAEEM